MTLLEGMPFSLSTNNAQDLGSFPMPIPGSDIPALLRDDQGKPQVHMPVGLPQLHNLTAALSEETIPLSKYANLLMANKNRCQASGAQIARNGVWSSGFCPASIAPSARLRAESRLRYDRNMQ